MREVLDLFSAAAGGWSLGMHRAGFRTVAACEFVDWRRTLYSENNPDVRMYDDVRTLTADQLVRDLGRLPGIIVGSPPCQDISSANTKGKGVEGERSGLFFEAARIIGEVRPRWFALENSANLRTRGADAVLEALEGLGYSCWTFVVGADDIGANHERDRAWIIGVDLDQLDAHPDHEGELRGRFNAEVGELQAVGDRDGASAADANGLGRDEGRSGRRGGLDLSVPEDPRDASEDGCGSRVPGRRAVSDQRLCVATCGDAANSDKAQRRPDELCRGDAGRQATGWVEGADQPRGCDEARGANAADAPDADQAGQADGRMVPGLRQAEIADDGRGSGRGDDGSRAGQMGLCEADRRDALGSRADWSINDLARHIRVDDGLPGWVAGTRIAVGGPRGTAAASLIVEAFGDAVVPQIPEAIGRAILRVEAAYAAVARAS